MSSKYDSDHRWRRRRYAMMIRNSGGGYPCARCGQLIMADEARGVLVTGAYGKLHIPHEQYLYTAITRAREELAVG